jgi:hypothetical protein
MARFVCVSDCYQNVATSLSCRLIAGFLPQAPQFNEFASVKKYCLAHIIKVWLTNPEVLGAEPSCQIYNFQKFLEMLDGAQTRGDDAGNLVSS